MGNETSREHGSQLSADRETIQGWAATHDAVPVRYTGTGGEAGGLRIVPSDRRTAEHEEVTWEEFHEEIDREDRAVVYHGADRDEPFEVLARDEVGHRTAIEDEAVEEALLEGEVVTTEVTETTVVERTIVEEATIESEVIDREVVEVDIVDAELLTRDVVDCEVTDLEGTHVDGGFEAAQFETGYRSDESVEVTVRVDEAWTVTKELLERLTVESRIADTDVTETDTVEDASVESRVNVEGIQRSILDSELIDTDAATTEVIESGSIETAYGEGEVVHTQLAERKTVEEEVSLERRYRGDITEGETMAASTIRRDVIESAIVGGEEIEFEMETVLDTETAVETDLEAGAEGETAVGSTGGAAGATGTTATAAGDDEAFGAAATPTEEDEGKTVVDTAGVEVGIVAEVEGETMYVDASPSLADKIRARLDWGEMDEDAYPVPVDRVVRVSDDEVELAVDESADRIE